MNHEPNVWDETVWAKRIRSTLGWRIRAERSDLDNDEHGNERIIPAGTLGVVGILNHVDSREGEPYFDVFYDNGGQVVLSWSEIQTECTLIEPPSDDRG